MVMHWILRRIKRHHNALWVNVRWLEPFGDAEWVVAVHVHKAPWNKEYHELSRHRSLIVAIWRAHLTTFYPLERIAP